MKSLGARLTLWYALSATATLAVLLALSYQLLENRLIHGLDELNFSEFQQIRAHLGPDYRNLSPEVVNARVRETSDSSNVLFYIVVDHPGKGIFFSSRNLKNRAIPDVRGKRDYSTSVPGVGELRVSEFVMTPFDVTIGTSMRQVRESMRSFRAVCAALLLAMLLISAAIGLGLSRMMLQPLRLIRETANRIRSDNLSERIPVGPARDEISELAALLNQMFDRLESAFDQIRRFADEASHELKTPLSLVRLHAEKMLGDEDLPPSAVEAVVVQLEELARLNRIIDELLFLSRAEAGAIPFELKEADARAFLDTFAQDAQALAAHHGLRFAHVHSGENYAVFEAKWMRQVLLNLLANAIRFSPSAGSVTVRSSVRDGVWRVSLADEGPGVPPESLARIFERFVRLNRRGEEGTGSGLGLAICRSILAMHGGRIWAEAGDHGRGLRVVFETPAEDARDRARRAHQL
jgi:two-component system heavy metal sensor histidine kinase CusS